ncbi:MAG: YqjF family protein [Myxococcales bacterium]
MAFELHGTEVLTIELSGSLPVEQALELTRDGLGLELREGRAVVSLLVFHMHGLRGGALPAPSFDYWEALWRVGVLWDGRPAWFGCACDLDHPLVAWAGRRLVRYPVRRASFSHADAETSCAVTVTVSGLSLNLGATCGEPIAAAPPRRLLVRSGGSLYEIPWDERPASYRRHAEIDVTDSSLAHATFGRGASFERVGVVHRGREHRCGLARRL